MMETIRYSALTIDLNVPKVNLGPETIANAFTLTFTVVGALAILFLLLGALRYGMSNGDQQAISQAKNTIIYSLIGVVVSASALTIVQFVLGNIGG